MNAQADEGKVVDFEIKEEPNWSYLVAPAEIGKLFMDMTREEIIENWKEMSVAKVKASVGLYGLGCFKRWPRHKSDNIIDARWVVIWKMIEGNVGVKCRLTVRFQGQVPGFRHLRRHSK